jgi:hypothetical protein
MAEGEYTSSGPTVDQMREDSRRALALKLLYIFAGILTITIIIASTLIWHGKLSFDNGLTLILAITSTFSGLLGSAMTFYFSSKSEK